MGSLLVVMVDVDAEDVLELAAAEDQQPVEAFAAYGADPALHVRVRVRRLDGRTDDLAPSLARRASNARGNFASRSWIKNALAGLRSSSPIRRLRPGAASTPCPVYRCRRSTRSGDSR